MTKLPTRSLEASAPETAAGATEDTTTTTTEGCNFGSTDARVRMGNDPSQWKFMMKAPRAPSARTRGQPRGSRGSS